jgi:hypothetical protein
MAFKECRLRDVAGACQKRGHGSGKCFPFGRNVQEISGKEWSTSIRENMSTFSHLQTFICDNRPFIDSISPFVARKDIQGKFLSLLAPCPLYNFSHWIEKDFPKFHLSKRLQELAQGPLGQMQFNLTGHGSSPKKVSCFFW